MMFSAVTDLQQQSLSRRFPYVLLLHLHSVQECSSGIVVIGPPPIAEVMSAFVYCFYSEASSI